MRLLIKIFHVGTRPVRSIEWVISFFTFIGGLYIFSPLYSVSVDQNGLGVLAGTFSHPIMILFWGAILLVGAILVMIGLWRKKPQLRSMGWFSIFLARTYQILTIFLVVGLYPITWIYPMTLTVIVVILWAVARYEVNESG